MVVPELATLVQRVAVLVQVATALVGATMANSNASAGSHVMSCYVLSCCVQSD